jgi:hypothetical protein
LGAYLSPFRARYKKAFGEWVPEGYETDLEELHRTVATNALETKFNALARRLRGRVAVDTMLLR